jgi:radical SAM protein with 4Fe4S-binding SPASM domain
VARYAKGRGVTTILLTNGLLVGDDSACEIAQTFDQVSISLDGSTAEMHEYFRGEGTFEPTVRAIDALIGKGVDVQVTVTLNRRNQNEIAALGRRFGGRVKYAPLYPAGNALKNRDLEISGGEYYDALRRGAVANAFCHLENIVRAHQECRTIMKCGLGDGTLSISCSGDVYPCQLLHFPEFLVGNVMRQHLEEIYRSPKMRGFQCHTVNDMEGCRDCDLKLLCGGACQARHFYETGSLDKCGGFCEYEKRGIFNGILENHAFA